MVHRDYIISESTSRAHSEARRVAISQHTGRAQHRWARPRALVVYEDVHQPKQQLLSVISHAKEGLRLLPTKKFPLQVRVPPLPPHQHKPSIQHPRALLITSQDQILTKKLRASSYSRQLRNKQKKAKSAKADLQE